MAIDRFSQMAADNKTLREQNAHLSRVLDSLGSKVSALESRDEEQQSWNAEAQKRVSRLETITGVTATRACPECASVYPDSVAHWPGYTSENYSGDPRCFMCFPHDAA